MEDASKLLTKKDWEDYKNIVTERLKQNIVDKIAYQNAIKTADKFLSKFKDEVDEIVDEVLEDD